MIKGIDIEQRETTSGTRDRKSLKLSSSEMCASTFRLIERGSIKQGLDQPKICLNERGAPHWAVGKIEAAKASNFNKEQ
jgi:hypothetical protein